ncbi:hypothetical protein EV421DRAFT_2040832 [Armillaria borealis]|uniref:F-box domain-containing protein n=1 Tax=Armillaria borealis TaxID=47425 RepID=A0AA39IYI3_9AGAR|nr:hypothetical protein EV421DRAFT_2040832 [Armillaria borealis]
MDPSAVLPVELLQKIFQHYLSDRLDPEGPFPVNPFRGQKPYGYRQTIKYFTPSLAQALDLSDGLWVLGKVNSAWRSATLSSQTLWSTVLITLSSRPQWSPVLIMDRAIRRLPFSSNSNIPSEILTEILHRSGNTPLSIALLFPIEVAREEVLSDSVSKSLFAQLSAQSHRWQSMELTAPAMIWEDFVQISPSRIEALRSLHATVSSGSFLFQIVGVCSCVVDLTIYVLNAASNGMDHPALPPIPVRMPFLQHLHIRSRRVDVLEAITAPCLQSLTLKVLVYGPDRPSFRSGFVDFIQRSHCSNSLTVLDLSCTCDYGDLVAMLSHTSSRYTSIPSLLPNLHTLLFEAPGVLQAADVNLILDMVESRIAGRLRNVRIGDVFSTDMEKLKGRLSSLNSLPNVAIEFEEIYNLDD